MVPRGFSLNFTLDNNFTDEVGVRYNVPVVKILLQMMAINKWLQINFDINA